jgi:serine protease
MPRSLALSALLAAVLVAPALGEFVPGEVLVAPRLDARVSSRGLAREAGFVVARTLPATGLLVLRTPVEETVEQSVARLSALSWVRYAQPNYIYRIPTPPHQPVGDATTPEVSARFTPNDPLFGRQWHLTQVGAQAAWDLQRGSSAVTIAIIDTGVAYRTVPGVVAQSVDLVGVSFVSPWDWVDGDAFPDDGNGHGTHVCGTLAEATNNGVGVAGLAHGCSIMPLRVLDDTGSGSTTDIVEAVQWAISHGADVINLSLGSPSAGFSEQEAFQAADDAGIVVAAAAGNDGIEAMEYPAAFASVLAVGAVTYGKARASYSNYGAGLDLVAPGGDSSLDENGDGHPDGVYQNTFDIELGDTPLNNDRYYYFDGTSMATPHVAASAALVIAHGGLGTPRAQKVRELLETTAENLGPSGWDKDFGYGLVRPDRALAYTAPPVGRSISGTIRFGTVALAGVTVRSGSASAVTNAAGQYTLSSLPTGALTVTPTLASYTFAPASRTVTLTGAVTGMDFAAGKRYANPLAAGVAIVSVPGTPLAGHMGAPELLGAGASGLYTYRPATSDYAVVAGPTLGQGYFARVGTGGAAIAAASATSTAVSVAEGFSLLGNPLPDNSLPFSSVRVRHGGTDYTLTQASDLGLSRSYGWLWDTATSSYKLLHATLPGTLHTVPRWTGFFLEALAAVQVVLPGTLSVASAESASEPSTAAVLSVRARAEDGREGEAWLGWLDSGPSLEAAPPSAPLGTPAGPRVLVATEDGAAGALVLTRRSGSRVYLLTVEPGDQPAGSRISLSFAGLETLPREWSPVVSAADGGHAVALRVEPSLEFAVPEGGTAIRLVLRMEDRASGIRLRLHDAETLRGCLEATYELSAQADVTGEVRNAAGRVIAELGPWSLAGGTHALRWDGRTSRGTLAPSGRYTLWLQATSARGERASATSAFER